MIELTQFMNGFYFSVILLTILSTNLYKVQRKLKKKKGNLMNGREYMLRLRRKWKPRGEKLRQTKLIFEYVMNLESGLNRKTVFEEKGIYRHSKHLNVT